MSVRTERSGNEMTGTRDSDRPVVFIVEDEPDVAETYELWLDDDYDVRRAEDGPTALDRIDGAVDVVLLDRMMPGMSGGEVLAALRDREYDGWVAMVTAVDPDFDIIEMGFDEYVTKPPTREELRETVESLLDRGEYVNRVREYHSLVSKRAALEAEKPATELTESDEFGALEDRIAAMRAELDGDAERLLDDAAFVGTLRDIDGGPGTDVDGGPGTDVDGGPGTDVDGGPGTDVDGGGLDE